MPIQLPYELMPKTDFETFQAATEAGYIKGDEYTTDARDRSVASYGAVQHSLGSWTNFDNILSRQSGRNEFTREHYEHFRPSEALPKKYNEIIGAIDKVYASLSIVRNVLDLMSDFGCEGIEVVHEVPAIEKFYRDWFKKVNGIDRSERFLSGLYRHGMVVVRQFNADVKYKNFNKKISLGSDIKLQYQKIKKNNIPIKYMFYNPAYFTHANYHEINSVPEYKFKMPRQINSNNFGSELNMILNTEEITLPTDRVYVAYYKKDDWIAKPIPLLYPVIKHAIMIEKLNLADSAALDGAISKVRLFKLGSLEHELYPDEGALSKLDEILRSHTGGGVLDILWGPDIELQESDTDISKFLGKEKYDPHLSQVYEGLGIPASFTGVGQGTTNNYISLKIMMRRLMSGRARLIEFWNHQFKQIQLAMGFAKPPTLEFNNLDLGDEESERQLLVQLLDRNIISAEKVQKILNFDPRMESKRIRKEEKDRERGKMPEKASQFHNPEKEFTLKRSALDKGFYAPEHVGLVKEPGTENIPTPNETAARLGDKGPMDEQGNQSKSGSGGRPKGSKDTVKRKTAIFTPKSKASLDLWVNKAQNTIHNSLKPHILDIHGYNNMRQLTTAQQKEFELLKFNTLCSLEPFQIVDKKEVYDKISSPLQNNDLYSSYSDIIDQMDAQGSTLSLDDAKSIQKHLYVESNYENI